MVQKSLAVVLNRFSYGESSIITKCFLKDYGKISFIVHGAKNKKNFKNSYFQPGNYLELLFYYKSNRNLQTLSKAAFHNQWVSIQKDFIKISYVMAIIELADKCTSDIDKNDELFNELINAISLIDNKKNQMNLVFWNFQYQLLRVLGFKPDFNQSELDHSILPDPFAGPNSKKIFHDFERQAIDFNANHKITQLDRLAISDYLNCCFNIQFENIKNLKSFEVLKQCMF